MTSNAVGRGGPVDPAPATRAPIGSQGRRRRKGRDEHQMVPDAEFTSYYGRPILKPSPWQADIPGYLFLGGLAAGSSLLGAGADLTDRPALRRTARVAALGAIGASFGLLVHDLGKPSRFVNMLRVAKPTSPMSTGTWVLTAYGPLVSVAAGAELMPAWLRRTALGRLLGWAARPMGLAAAGIAPVVASYTAVLLSDTATPTWHDAHHHLPFVFVGSASAAAGGLAMLTSPVAETGPARRLAVAGAAVELAVAHRMEQSMGLTGEPLSQGRPGQLMRASRLLTAVGALTAAAVGHRRVPAALAGIALLAGSACTRFGVFEAGQESAKDPRYVVVPQRAGA